MSIRQVVMSEWHYSLALKFSRKMGFLNENDHMYKMYKFKFEYHLGMAKWHRFKGGS